MTVDKGAFVSDTRDSYKWPSPKPLTARPSHPPQKTKPNNWYVAKLVEPYCHCDAHLYESKVDRYRSLAKKEMLLYQELEDLGRQMARVSGDILDHPCDGDDVKMETIYQLDYTKRGLPLVKYRKLMSDIDSPVGAGIKEETAGLGYAYRDPHAFRYHAFPKPHIDVCNRVVFDRTPTMMDEWFAPRTGATEYQDTISKIGIEIIKNRQQYMEPLPSSRRRIGNACT